jgi:transmembrane sensor
MTSEKIWELVQKKLTQKITSEESLLLDEWINKNSENRKQFDEALLLWHNTVHQPDLTTFDNSEAWMKVSERVQPRVQIRTIRFYVSRIAAAICIMGVLAVTYRYFNKQSDDSHIVIRTKAGETKEIRLPDSSKVWLNENSELSYTKPFLQDTIRIVTLNGEAFFDVTHNAQKSFIVRNNSFNTRVLGTSFNLNLHAIHPSIIVVTGKVRFSYCEDDSLKSSVIAEAGYQAELSKDQLIKSVSKKNKMAWHTGILEFQNEALEEVVQDIISLYHVPIKLDISSTQNYKYTGVIEHLSLETAIETICFSLNLHWKKTSNGYSLFDSSN